MDRDQLLSRYTFNDDNTLDISQRVFQTLTQPSDGANRVEDRPAKLLALLVEQLSVQGLISDSELDTLLLGAVNKLD